MGSIRHSPVSIYMQGAINKFSIITVQSGQVILVFGGKGQKLIIATYFTGERTGMWS